MSQLHKKFTNDQIKELIERYLKKEIERKYIQEILGIKERRFFSLLKQFKQDPESFSIQYKRKSKTRKIPQSIEGNIIKELAVEQEIIRNKDVPLKFYNYSYIKDILERKYDQKVSLPTIIDRARRNGFYLKKPKRTIHDREVLTNYVGELIQHDSSHHLFSPPAKEKWYLITSLDDYSRFLLYATFVKKETSWAHIMALQSVILKYGLPYSYYVSSTWFSASFILSWAVFLAFCRILAASCFVSSTFCLTNSSLLKTFSKYVDSHSIFRFVQGRDSFWRKHYKLTDEANPQWKQVLNDCNVKVTYALSPQAKGKIERPYGWLQDRLIRTCVREDITDVKQAQIILNQEIQRYNYRQVHSTTHEVPYFRFRNALKENKSLFREFRIKSPFKSVKDIFCLRINRIADSYRKISINNLQLRVNHLNPREIVNLRIYPLENGISEIRFWCNEKLIDVQTNVPFAGKRLQRLSRKLKIPT